MYGDASTSNEGSNNAQRAQFYNADLSTNEGSEFTLNASGNSVDQIIESVFDSYKNKLEMVTAIDLSVNPILDESHKIFTYIEHKMPNVKILSMDDCMINQEIQDIASIVPQLEQLILSNNIIENKGVEYIVEGLRSSNNIMLKLDLSHNKITDQGIKLIMDAIKDGSAKIQQLNLSHNQISEHFFRIISKAISSNKCVLKELYLNGYYMLEGTRQFRQLRRTMEKLVQEREICIFVDGTQMEDQPLLQGSIFIRTLCSCFRKIFA